MKEAICSNCKNRVHVVKYDDWYSYKRDHDDICSVTGQKLYSFHPVLKCSAFEVDKNE